MMRTVQTVPLAVMTFILPLLIGCQAMSRKPPETVSGPTGVETAQDATLSKAVREKLLTEKSVNLSPVLVEAREGSVYLSGIVPTLDARERAAKLSWQVPGVKSVLNHLQVGK